MNSYIIDETKKIMEDIIDFIKKNLIKIAFVILAAILAVSSITIIPPGHEALITRFKKYTKVLKPGMHFLIPVFEQCHMVNKNITKTTNLGFKENGSNSITTMITHDENILTTEVVILWKIKNTKDFLFNVENIHQTVKDIGESVLRDVVSSSKLIEVISNKKNEIETKIAIELDVIMTNYQAGIEIIQVQLLKASTPTKETENAYREVQAAKAFKEELINSGKEYANKKVNLGESEKATMILNARSFAEQQKAEIEKFSKEFNALANNYSKLNNIEQKDVFLNMLIKNGAEEILKNKTINIVPESTLNHKQV